MSTGDIERFEAAAGELLNELGYPRAVPCPRAESLEGATRICNLLAQDPIWLDHASEGRAGGGNAFAQKAKEIG